MIRKWLRMLYALKYNHQGLLSQISANIGLKSK